LLEVYNDNYRLCDFPTTLFQAHTAATIPFFAGGLLWAAAINSHPHCPKHYPPNRYIPFTICGNSYPAA
jgi:hypothetical protein